MNISQQFLTQNDCYKANRAITPRGVMVHSTAAPGVMAGAWPARWNKPRIEVAVHAFLDDRGVVQTLPWTLRGWHCGAAYSGGPSANNTHIAFEICEPNEMIFTYRPVLKRGVSGNAFAVRGVQRQLAARGLYAGAADGSYGPLTEAAVKAYQSRKNLASDGICGPGTWRALGAEPERLCAYNPDAPAVKDYFEAAYANAAALTAMLCGIYRLDPLSGNTVISHSEGYMRKIASNHADVTHWFPLHGRGMDSFRRDVKARLGSSAPAGAGAAGRPVLRRGAAGPDVRDMQALLLKAGQSLPKFGADGSFGPETENAVTAFQKARGLTIDGICGPQTWGALYA
ncbi:MAG: N-acetylmuramoyl-L-alanine amidase [Oscillospiraceae bacterium]|nr:N-acetylmuramoyl-L-alanine amidase [Oscillospiraceae bacterium]